MMSKSEDQRTAARQKAEQLLTQSKKKESERVAARERDSRALDEKIARLRGLRLAKEAEERSAAPLAAPPARKKAGKAVLSGG